MWYEKDFTYDLKPGRRVFLHIGAANYKSNFWVNGTKVCEHEGGFTAFNCEVTPALKAGSNFVIAAVDDTRHEDGVPTTQTDWFNYGGLTREVSLIEVPGAFIDQYDVHLSRVEPTFVEGWAHVTGAAAGAIVSFDVPELKARGEGKVGESGIAVFHANASGLTRWTPETPKLYTVKLHAGADAIEDEIGFRTVEAKGNEILLNGKPVFLRGVSIHAEAPYRDGSGLFRQGCGDAVGLG